MLFLSGILKLLYSPAAMFGWKKKTGAGLYPFLIGAGMYFAVVLVRGAVRSGFSRDDAVKFFVMQGILTAVVEELARFAAFRFLLKKYQSRHDAVSHGIGHGILENLGAAVATFGLIGTEKASDLSFLMILDGTVGQLCGTVWHIAMSVFMFYGIQKDKAEIFLPSAILIHFIFVIAVTPEPLLDIAATAAFAFAAYKLYSNLDYTY